MAATESVLTQVPVIERVSCDNEYIYAHLTDGRELGIPLAWSDRLAQATPEQRANYEIAEFGAAIRWPDVDEDIGLSSFLGVAEDVIYEALGFASPKRSTEDYLALAE